MSQRVALLGGPGAFSEEAAEQLLGGASFQGVYRQRLAEVAATVAQGDVDLAVLPVENSIAGPVEESWQGWWEHRLFAFAETTLAVHQCLMGLPGVTLEEVSEAWSHPQALGQCAPFLEQHGIRAVPVTSTVAGAEAVLARKARHIASLGSARTAKRHGLVVLASDVQSRNDNATRFVAVGRNGPAQGAGEARFNVIGVESPGAVWEGWTAWIGAAPVRRERSQLLGSTVLRWAEVEGALGTVRAPARLMGSWLATSG